MKPFHRSGSSHIQKLSNRAHTVNFSNKASLPSEKEGMYPGSLEPGKDGPSICSHTGSICQEQIFPFTSIADLPAIPPFEVRSPNEMNIMDLQKNLQNMYEYNVSLRDRLIAACSMIDVLAKKEPPSTVQYHDQTL
ncbi:hypothetical protein F511_34731 [Dorcoceras hygrometricum]|uniref:Uncharacterized protein n=1 Tax=Dorcoceras hygrometricum TaxID=472368 RepID=A0A2Z7B533_9LAMI|nr:hypothetical protein F511_34731 [Dorcoceras hygrometricum]